MLVLATAPKLDAVCLHCACS